MNRRYGMTGLMIVVVLVGSVLLLRKNAGWEAVADTNFPEVRAKGARDAPVQIDEFSDFQCPACQVAQPILLQAFQSFPGKVRLQFHHYPLPGHPWAALAHQAAECAASQGRFWPYHDRLFGEQKVWPKTQDPTETFLTYARDLGFDLDRYAACLADEGVRQVIQEEKKRGDELKVSSTPTFFINGERFVGHIELATKGLPHIRKLLGLTEPPPAAEK